MKKTVFTGSGVAIATPMHEDGSVNFERLDALIDFHLENKTDSIISCGTTGESATLSHEEHCKVLEHTIRRVNKRIPVIAGVGSNDTAYSLELAKEAAAYGADALLSVTPYYNKASQAGLVKHFTYVADRVDLPMILYNVPSRTGCSIQPETYLELSKHPNIVATKEANGNISAIAKTIALCGDDLDIYSGNDDQVVPLLSLGGIGVISVLSNVAPKYVHDMVMKYLEGNVKESAKMQLDAIPLCNALFCEVNPIPVKAALNMMGKNVGSLRAPLTEMEDAHKETLRQAMKDFGLL